MPRNAAAVCAGALAFTGLLTGCGGGGGDGGTAVTGATKKCVSRWNDPRNRDAQGAAGILSLDLGGTPAALVQAKQHGGCEVVLGAVDSSYAFNVFFYEPAERAYLEDRTREGPGKAAKLPPWNAKPNEDGTLTIGPP